MENVKCALQQIVYNAMIRMPVRNAWMGIGSIVYPAKCAIQAAKPVMEEHLRIVFLVCPLFRSLLMELVFLVERIAKPASLVTLTFV